jgi:hypothetical protein
MPADMRMVGQMTVWNHRMSFPMMCTFAGQNRDSGFSANRKRSISVQITPSRKRATRLPCYDVQATSDPPVHIDSPAHPCPYYPLTQYMPDVLCPSYMCIERSV